MKSTKLVTTLALSSLALLLAAPSVLAENEAAKSLKGNGYIEYIKDDSPNPPTDPEKPDPVDPQPPVGPVNPNKGDLSIDMVTDLNFKGDGEGGKAKITTNQGVYRAAAVNGKSNGQDITRGNWVQITDKRPLVKDTPAGWTVTAELTKQFTNPDEGTLKGATIDYTNPLVTSKEVDGSASNIVTTDIQSLSQKLEFGGGSKEMAKAEAGKGWGTYYVQYGRASGFGGLTDETETASKSVILTVPANTPLAAEKYAAEITWTIAEL